MAHILITSGPTREFFDPIRFISNQSSGRMGSALAAAGLKLGHRITIISGPVDIEYPSDVDLLQIQSTSQMQDAVESRFPSCDGIIAAAAPCDFRPLVLAKDKIKKNGKGLSVKFEETTDILKLVSREKQKEQWSVGFALETENGLANALKKLKEKNLDLIVLNGPSALRSQSNHVRIVGHEGVIGTSTGLKSDVAQDILALIQRQLISPLPGSQ